MTPQPDLSKLPTLKPGHSFQRIELYNDANRRIELIQNGDLIWDREDEVWREYPQNGSCAVGMALGMGFVYREVEEPKLIWRHGDYRLFAGQDIQFTYDNRGWATSIDPNIIALGRFANELYAKNQALETENAKLRGERPR